MEDLDRETLAAARAQAYAPAPRGRLVMAGVCGAGVVSIGDLVASRFYGWPVAGHWPLSTLGLVLGFLTGLTIFRRLARLNRRARTAERRIIDAEEGSLPK
jgi:hypothetical protein